MRTLLGVLILTLVNFATFAKERSYTVRDGILTDSYGLVTKKDIQDNLDEADPIDSEGKPMLVWQCVHVDHLRTHCFSAGYSDNIGAEAFHAGITVTSGRKKYEFMTRGVGDWPDCVDYRNAWIRLIRGQIACFSGYFNSEEPSDERRFDTISYWVLDKIKSKKGKWSYFANPGW
jgi:hypothetical protein